MLDDVIDPSTPILEFWRLLAPPLVVASVVGLGLPRSRRLLVGADVVYFSLNVDMDWRSSLLFPSAVLRRTEISSECMVSLGTMMEGLTPSAMREYAASFFPLFMGVDREAAGCNDDVSIHPKTLSQDLSVR